MTKRATAALGALLLVTAMAAPSIAIADDASSSEATSAEAAKEAPVETLVEETKKAEEVIAAPAKDEPVAPVAPVVPTAPDPVVVDPTPGVVPAPIQNPVPVIPAPAEPKVEIPPAPAAPVAPAANSVPATDAVTDPAASTLVAEALQDEASVVEEETPTTCESPSTDPWAIDVFTNQAFAGWGQLMVVGTVPDCTPPGSTYGNYRLVLTGARFWPVANTTVVELGPLVTADGETIDSGTSFYACAEAGATYALVDVTTGLPVVGPNLLTNDPSTSDPRCGTTPPVQAVIEVNPPKPAVTPAGPDQKGSVTVPEIRINDCATFVATPAGAYEGDVSWSWVLDAETPTKKCVFAPGVTQDQIGGTVHLGDYEEGTVEPNPGIYPDYIDYGLIEPGIGTLTPRAPFNQKDSVGLGLSGTSKVDGSVLTIEPIFQDTWGLAPVVVQVDLSQFCGLVKYTWYTQTGASKGIIGASAISLPACDGNETTSPAYTDGWLYENGDAGLLPKKPFSWLDTAKLRIDGFSKVDGSAKSYERVFTRIDGTTPLLVHIDELSGFCGAVEWSWVSETKDGSASSQLLLFSGKLKLSDCGPFEDDEDDNENPWNPWHPGHGGWGDCHSWNHHSCEPGNNGPTTGQDGEENGNGGTDSSVDSFAGLESFAAGLPMGGPSPFELEPTHVYTSEQGELAKTGVSNPWMISAFVVGGIVALIFGVLLFVSGRRSKREAV